MSLFKKKSQYFYNNKGQNTEFDFSIYCPHPFTNWSLNPGYSHQGGEKQHTAEGFRKTSTDDELQKNEEALKIFCIGGSSTYCTEIYDYKDTWPYKLQEKLKEATGREVIVYNAGVGGWGTLQSLVRYSAWGPTLKPDLTIIYQSKNDLTPFYNGRRSEDEILPLLDNVTLQLSAELGTSTKDFKKNNGGVACVYGDQIKPGDDGLERFNEDFANLTNTRYQMITQLSSTWGGKTLLMPELINGSAYLAPMNIIHDKMKNLADQHDNANFFDVRGLMPFQDNYFQDKMHFTPEGCDVFSDLLVPTIRNLF